MNKQDILLKDKTDIVNFVNKMEKNPYHADLQCGSLKLTELSIGDISNAVGYPSQLHFSRAFKNVYGISPRLWRTENKVVLWHL